MSTVDRESRRDVSTGARSIPLDADLTPSASGTGYASTFARAGFKVVGCHTPPRPKMRLHFSAANADT